MIPDEVENSVPVHLFTAPIHNVGDVCTVETLPATDEQLRHQQLFGAENSRLDSQHERRACARDPRLIDDKYSVAHAGDKVDEETAFPHLRKPNGIRDFAFKSSFGQD